jgi:hypothetical protein
VIPLQKIRNLRSRLGLLLAVTALCVVGVAQSAMAAANADAVTAVGDASTTLSDTIKSAIPLILAVAAIMVVVGLAKKLVRKAG